jgi:hypothetical protein
MEKQETLEILPRYLCLSIEGPGTSRFYFSPANEVIGNALRRSPRILDRIIRSTGRYKSWQTNQYEEGRSYEPKFPWPAELLKEDYGKLPEIVRNGTKKKDGTFILFDAEPHEAVRNLTLKGNVLTAEVKSKRSVDETRPKYYKTLLRSAFVDPFFGTPDLTELWCTCDDYAHDLEKGGRKISGCMQCTHNSAARSEFEERVYLQPHSKVPMKTKGKISKIPLFSPFNFTPNWAYRNGMYQPKDRHLAALEGDVLITYYAIGGEDDDIFGINERLLAIPECYSPSMLEWIRTGKVTRRVLGQQRKKEEMDRVRQKDERKISAIFDAELRSKGYEYDGMCRELGRIAQRYVNEHTGTVIGLALLSTEPSFYTIRTPVTGSRIIPIGEYSGEPNPMKLVGKHNLKAFDDVTMKDTGIKVELPTVLRIPESEPKDMKLSRQTRKYFKDELRKAYGREVPGIEKYSRVHFSD